MKADLKADLHCHTHYSDGKHAVSFLVERALENGVTHLAISDHDCTSALSGLEAVEGLSFIRGVEISCSWEQMELHIVGLCIDPSNVALQQLLREQQTKRLDRVVKMDQKLEALGTKGLLASLQDSHAIALTRSHVADFLVDHKVCKTRQKAFKTHLNKQGKMYVSSDWCSLEQGVAAIKNAGGIAVIAHPGRYPLNRTKLRRLVESFKTMGGDALEASYPHIAPSMQQDLEKLCVEFGLYVSCGSDFHDAEAHWTDVGKFPPLASNVEEHAVWHHPIWMNQVGEDR
ncbi:MAG: putative metal-dependent phosphoesterase TrpH [Candidatus Azotimanducaceae bacterium]